MSALITEPIQAMSAPRPTNETRERLDLRVEQSLRRRIEEASVRIFGIANLSAYIRMAIIERLERDEANLPTKKKRG